MALPELACKNARCPADRPRLRLADSAGFEMGAVTITVDSRDAFKQSVKAAIAGEWQPERIPFESFELLTPDSMALVQAMRGIGPVALREAARRVSRDVRAVHSDVRVLLNAGVLRKDAERRIELLYTGVHVDFLLNAAA